MDVMVSPNNVLTTLRGTSHSDAMRKQDECDPARTVIRELENYFIPVPRITSTDFISGELAGRAVLCAGDETIDRYGNDATVRASDCPVWSPAQSSDQLM